MSTLAYLESPDLHGRVKTYTIPKLQQANMDNAPVFDAVYFNPPDILPNLHNVLV